MGALLDFVGSVSPGADPIDFAPSLTRIQERPPAPMAGVALNILLSMLAALIVWASVGKLDIVMVAEGKLVPSSYIKIVQPAEQGVIKEIMVREGERVIAGQILIRMDPVLANADVASLFAEYHTRRLTLRRIDAELSGAPFAAEAGEAALIASRASEQYSANIAAYHNALNAERSVLEKAMQDWSAAREIQSKLLQTLPHYREQERAYAKLTQDGFAGRLMFTDKQRELIEKEQDLKAQEFAIRSAEATIEQSKKKLLQITADYQRQLLTERVEAATQMEKSRQELAKNSHRQSQLELRAPQSGTVKDLATHTAGTVASPGSILMTLVPREDAMMGEVWVSNKDIGFVKAGQEVRLKLHAFQFQKYGMVEGTVGQVSVDATDTSFPNQRSDVPIGRDRSFGSLAYRAIINLKQQHLETQGSRFPLGSGMQIVAEINLGKRTVLEYLLSPIQKAFHEAGRER